MKTRRETIRHYAETLGISSEELDSFGFESYMNNVHGIGTDDLTDEDYDEFYEEWKEVTDRC